MDYLRGTVSGTTFFEKYLFFRLITKNWDLHTYLGKIEKDMYFRKHTGDTKPQRLLQSLKVTLEFNFNNLIICMY